MEQHVCEYICKILFQSKLFPKNTFRLLHYTTKFYVRIVPNTMCRAKSLAAKAVFWRRALLPEDEQPESHFNGRRGVKARDARGLPEQRRSTGMSALMSIQQCIAPVVKILIEARPISKHAILL